MVLEVRPSDAVSGARVARSFAWEGGALAIGQGISWIATIFVIRLLSPGDYGLMAMAQIWMGFLLMVSELGIGVAVVQQERLLEGEQVRILFGLVLLTNLAGAALTFSCAPIVAAFFDEPRVVPLLRVMCVGFGLLSLYVLPQALLIRQMSFDRKARVEVVAAVGAALLSVALAAAGLGVWALVGGSLGLHGLKAIAFQLVRPCLPRPSFALRSATESFRFGGLTTLSRILWWATGSVDIAIAGRVLGETVLGIYSVALSLASTPVNKVMPVLTQVSLAAFSRMQEDRDRVRRNVHRALQSVGLVVFPAFIGLAAVAPEVIRLVLGEKWSAAVIPCQLLCVILPLRTLGGILAPAVFGIGRPEVIVVNRFLTLAVMSAAFLVGVQWGLIGLCLGWVVAYPPIALVTSLRALHALEIPAREAASDLAFFAAATGVMALVLLALRGALGPMLSPAQLLACLIAAGMLVYGGILLRWKPRLLREFRSLVREDA